MRPLVPAPAVSLRRHADAPDAGNARRPLLSRRSAFPEVYTVRKEPRPGTPDRAGVALRGRAATVMRARLHSLEGHSVSLWDVEHAFWWKSQQQSVIITEGAPQKPIVTGKDSLPGLPEGYVPPVVSILPLLAVNDEQVAKLCEQIGRSVEKVFEERIAILFKMFGFVVEALGQGYGRMPDGIAISPENHYAIIFDAKVRKDGYSLGTDDRSIKDYIVTHSERLKYQGVKTIYFMVISSSFRGDFDETIRTIRIETDVRDVVFVEVQALLTILERKLRDPQYTLGASGLQRLISSSGMLTNADVLEYFG